MSNSYAEYLMYQVAAEEESMKLDRLYRSVLTEQNNLYNFNEIVSGLKKHSSAECLAFAQDLLGSNVSLEENKQIDPKKAQGLMATLKRWAEKFGKVIRWCIAHVKKKINEIKLKLRGTKGVVDVTYRPSHVEEMCNILRKSPMSIPLSDLERLHTILQDNKGNKYKLSLQGDCQNYCYALFDILGVLEARTDEIRDFSNRRPTMNEVMKFMEIKNSLPGIQTIIMRDIAAIEKALKKEVITSENTMDRPQSAQLKYKAIFPTKG